MTRAEAAAIARATRRLRQWYRVAPPAAIVHGRQWYREAAAEAARLAAVAPPGIGVTRTAAVIAALSPRSQWGQNVAGARAAVIAAAEGRDPAKAAAPYALGDGCRKAARILAGEHPADVLRGPKVTAFWRAIVGDPESVTIDLWAARAAGYDPDRLTPARLRVIRAAYAAAARWAGETPRDFQAIAWLAVRGWVPSDAATRMAS